MILGENLVLWLRFYWMWREEWYELLYLWKWDCLIVISIVDILQIIQIVIGYYMNDESYIIYIEVWNYIVVN